MTIMLESVVAAGRQTVLGREGGREEEGGTETEKETQTDRQGMAWGFET